MSIFSCAAAPCLPFLPATGLLCSYVCCICG
jgi:hypothetical protein